MKVTNGDTAYLVLRRTQDDPLQLSSLLRLIKATGAVAALSSSYIFHIPLKGNTEFHTYTIDLKKEIDSKDILSRSEKGDTFSQIGILFPALTGDTERHILIDYVHLLEYPVEPAILSPFLVQKAIPPIDEIEQQIRQKMDMKDPDFDVPYDAIPSEKELAYDKPVKLVEISPKDPAPAVLQDGKFFLTDTGEFSGDEAQGAPLNYGERYVYTIELLDRKKQKSAQPGALTVEYTRIPRAPYNLKAEPGDKEIRLTWNRPFLTVDGKKIQSFGGYNIFRSVEPNQYPDTPIYRASPYDTLFIDKALSNGVRYYYVIQSIVPTIGDTYVGDFSQEVSAIPMDNIPPDVPTGLVGVYMNDQVNMFWNVTQADDFAGFNIYRSEDPTGEFQQINSQPILQASYQDTTIEANKTYYYYVTSFDDATPINESQPTDVAVVETSTFE